MMASCPKENTGKRISEWKISPASAKLLGKLMDAHEKSRGRVYGVIHDEAIQTSWKSVMSIAWSQQERSTVEMIQMFGKIATDICKSEKIANRANPVTKDQLIGIAFATYERFLGLLNREAIGIDDFARYDGFELPTISKILVKAATEAFDSVRKQESLKEI